MKFFSIMFGHESYDTLPLFTRKASNDCALEPIINTEARPYQARKALQQCKSIRKFR